MPSNIVPLRDEHLEDAAALVTARFRGLRELVPALPPRYEDITAILPMLRNLAGHAPGVVAMRGSRLAGFLMGFVIPEFRGKRSVYSPEWANAADLDDSRRIYQEMYARLAASWVTDRCFTHLITVMANDPEGIDTWHWLGSGMLGIDAVRDLGSVQGPIARADIRPAEPDDIETVQALGRSLRQYMRAAPIFLSFDEEEEHAVHKAWLEDPAHAVWLAYQGAEAVAYMVQGPANPEACTIMHDPGTTSIIRAFVTERMRGRGIATALLDRTLDWAHTEGYERCAVDFEPMNVLADRFWLRHFQPFCYSLNRQIDESGE
ncbi:MAG: GNAT family N-acetyltransferase [Chloroflexi bacterium]|nr:GNAT family N-acetyltransferase [Chloroflexota bacterium]MBU1751735.1 GNAT family N-acetyltransferase [Chloroflexota bacterium]